MSKQDTPKSWNGVPEIIATGSSWEIGLIHGREIPHRIAQGIENYKVLFLETAEADWPTSRSRAAAYLPSLETAEPDLVEEMRGIAAGANVDLLDILTLNLRSEISLTNYSDGCTSFSAVNSAGDVLLAQNWDWVEEAGMSTAFFDIHKEGKPRIRIFGEAGIVGKFGFNEHGLGACMNAIRCGTVDKTKLPVHLAIRRILECRSFDEALDMLSTKGLASCVNFMIADKSGNFATIECTPKGLAIIRPEPGVNAVFHTNHLWSSDVPKGIHDHPSQNSFDRLERIKALSSEQDVSIDSIRRWMSDEVGAPVSICRSVPPNTKGIERMTTLSTIIMDLGASKAELSLGRPSLCPPIRTLQL